MTFDWWSFQWGLSRDCFDNNSKQIINSERNSIDRETYKAVIIDLIHRNELLSELFNSASEVLTSKEFEVSLSLSSSSINFFFFNLKSWRQHMSEKQIFLFILEHRRNTATSRTRTMFSIKKFYFNLFEILFEAEKSANEKIIRSKFRIKKLRISRT